MLIQANAQIQQERLKQQSSDQLSIRTAGHLRGHSFSLSNNLGSLYKPSVLVLALLALSNIPGANAGPMAYGICIDLCFAACAAFPPLLPACVFGCLPLLAAHTL